MQGKKQRRNIKKKIIQYVMSVSIILGTIITAIMIFSSIKLTDYILLDSLQLMAKTASQSVSANLHLLADRIFEISIDPKLVDEELSGEERRAVLKERETRIEFVWLSVYDVEGRKSAGDSDAPDTISDEKYFADLLDTGNIVIAEPRSINGDIQLAVGAPLKLDNETVGYVVGSYKYDVVNDVLSNINLGATGSAYIINEDGLVVADKDIENIINKVNVFNIHTSSKNQATFQKILNFQTGSTKMKMEGISHYAAYAPVSGTNWAMIIEVPAREFTSTLATAIIICIIAAIILLSAAAVFIFYFAGKISKSLEIATVRLEALSEGDLTNDVIVTKTEDEAEVLTTALSATVRRLNRYINDIRSTLGAFSDGDYGYVIPDSFAGDFSAIRKALVTIAKSLNSMMKQMNDASHEIAENSQAVSENSKELFDGSSRQTEAIERLNDGIRIFTKHIEQITESTQQVTNYASATSQRVEQGNVQMDKMLKSMSNIFDSMEKIMQISKMIEQISSQTRLLSFNASIEAGRAGEAGRGFSVVATQIGQLAGKTAEALKSTADIVEQTNKNIAEGMEAANMTAESLQQIQEASDNFVHITEVLEEAVSEQKSAVEQVNVEISSVQSIAENNLDVVRRNDDSVSQFLSQAEQLKEFVEQVKLYDK